MIHNSWCVVIADLASSLILYVMNNEIVSYQHETSKLFKDKDGADLCFTSLNFQYIIVIFYELD